MFETAGAGLHELGSETAKLIRALFNGKRCCKCERSAVRLFGKHYYCDQHFPPPSGKTSNWLSNAKGRD